MEEEILLNNSNEFDYVQLENILDKYFNTIEQQEKENKLNQEKLLKEQQEQQKQEEEEQKELLKEKEKEEKEQQEFYSNIQLIAENSESNLTNELLNNVNTSLSCLIMINSVLIGIICIKFFGGFFKR